MMRFRMLSVDPALQSPEAGGLLLVAGDGRVLTGTPLSWAASALR